MNNMSKICRFGLAYFVEKGIYCDKIEGYQDKRCHETCKDFKAVSKKQNRGKELIEWIGRASKRIRNK
jgi:hypothetical protein